MGSTRLFGNPPFDRLAHPHALIAAADAFFGVSLAGSLFFNVSLDAARPRIVLYLLVTMAPFAVVAPLVGPFVDRLPGGQRMLIAVTCAGRGIVCLNLAGELRTLLFYPLAFSILVLGKTCSVAKNALIPRLVGDPDALVAAIVAPHVRRSVHEERLLASALTFVAGLSLIASLGPGRPAMVAVALVVGTSANTGRQAFDSLVQRDAPDVERRRLFARFETRFQLAWVLGALGAVAAEPPIWAGFLLVGVVTGLAALSYLGIRRSTPAQAPTERAAPGVQTRPLSTAEKLVAAAAAHAERGEHEAAVILAAAAADTASRSTAHEDHGAATGPDRVELADELQRLRRGVMHGAAVSADEATRALDLANSLVLPPREPRRGR